ncbi:MAG: acetate--CoA ligase family protein [Chloroflexi bacterium]|nr:acetate--CoA ligase family protein [Chloroflexota bacterium]
MDGASIIAEARHEGRAVLTEVEAKELVQQAGIPVAVTRLARSREEAQRLAAELGFPAVLKVVSPDILHKSDIGGVRLGLQDAAQVGEAYDAILRAAAERAPKAHLHGVAVQKMAPPGIEVVIGATRHPLFGPVLMFGLGGVLVEVLKDVSFRLAPLAPRDARRMVGEIQGFPVLQGFRGGPPVGVVALEEALLKLSDLMEAHPEVKELDLNPVLAYPDGILAVDARAILGNGGGPSGVPVLPVTHEEMDRLFSPQVVAVVGDKPSREERSWLRFVQTLKGRVYSVQIDPKEAATIEAMGIKNYPSLLEIPEPVDLVIVSVPRQASTRVLADAIQKGVNAIMYFTAGFAETGEEEGVRLQEELRAMALKAHMKLVGPNCMGLFNPAIGLRHNTEHYYGEAGNVAFISQSGTHAQFFSLTGYQQGIKISKSVSMGNGIVLHAADYLEYMAGDPQTKVVGMYLEGVPDGQRFFQVLREACRRKPVVIWKGGQTSEGARAVASHTASLAAEIAIWDAMMKQCNALRADSFDQLLDLVRGLLYIKPALGARMALLAQTGGQSVVITDAFVKAGLQVPQLDTASYERLAAFFSTTGGSYRNPLDMTPTMRDLDLVRRVMEIVSQDSHVDAVCHEINVGFIGRNPGRLQGLLTLVAEFKERFPKPYFCVLAAGHREKEAVDIRQQLTDRGIVAFASFERGAATFRKLVDYYDAARELGQEQAFSPRSPS